MLKVLVFLLVLTPIAAMADTYNVGVKYSFPPGVMYCEGGSIENQVEMLDAGVNARVDGCYKTKRGFDMKLIKNFPDLGYSKWIIIIDDTLGATYYLPNSLLL
ncbi:hypothetical protein QDY63_14780 [Pseudomonas brenneri]|uniref:hypothetical protein n=1 Tax=Pseudomonas brenneri TaxID=129817 RepID=UPI0025A09FF9|nr:hypothetical protein [Pseudomonas brenneri]WJM94079.1 hypothetical protein QDY63_14780 [Pseudomonas brenneri]